MQSLEIDMVDGVKKRWKSQQLQCNLIHKNITFNIMKVMPLCQLRRLLLQEYDY